MGQKVYFLPLSKKGKEQLSEAEIHMTNANLQWIELSCDEINNKPCIKSYLTDKAIFVCCPLEGDAYDKLLANGAKVYGVGALISSLQMKCSLPRKSKDFTQGCVSSMALRSKNVCFTNVPKDDREALQKKVARMAGYVCSTMTQEVDILVVGESTSKKYIVASELGKKTVTCDFITEMWSLSVEHIRPIIPDCDLYNELLKTHSCPVFHGLGICVTNIDQESREAIADLVVQNGGTYNGTLDRNTVTHLVAGGLGGKKIKHARSWGIEIVTMKWIEDSAKRGFAQNIEQKEYKFDEESLEQASQIEMTSKGFVNETEASILDEKTDMFDLDKFAMKEHDIEEDAFNRVSAFISGFPPRGKRKLKELIQKGGGTVFDSLTPSITHMIVARQSLENNEDLAYWRSMTSGRPFAIDLFWVINTIKNGERENPEGYKVLNIEGTLNEGDETLRMEARSFNGDLPKESSHLEQSTFGTLEVTESQAAESSFHSPVKVKQAPKNTSSKSTKTRRPLERDNNSSHTRKSHIPIENSHFENEAEPTSATIVDDRVTVRILPGGEDHPMRKVFGVEDFWKRKECRLVKNADRDERVDYAVSFLLVRGDLKKWEDSFETCFYFEGLENAQDIESVEERENTKVYWCGSTRLFSGAGFCTAKYQENEKKLARQAAEAGGGKFSASMDSHVTHVIAPDWSGPKQAKAVSGDLPCITLDWIITCLEKSLVDNLLTWHSVSMDEFEPAGVKPKPALPKPVAKSSSSKKSKKANRYESVMVESPCVSARTPKIVHRPNLSEMAKFVETPKNMRDPTLPSTVECQRILKQAVEDSDVERCKRDKIGIYSKSAVKEREKRELEPKTPKATNVPKLNFDCLVPEKGAFEGYSLYIHESIASQSSLNIIDKIEAMGAEVTFKFDRKKNFTHCVIVDQLEEENLENITKLASEYNISLVMFDWLKNAVVSNTVPPVENYQNFKRTDTAVLNNMKIESDTGSGRDSAPHDGRSSSRTHRTAGTDIRRKKRSRSRLESSEDVIPDCNEEKTKKVSKRSNSPSQDEIEELSSGEFAETETAVDLKSSARLKRIANEKHNVLFSLVGKELKVELKKMIEEINGSVLLTTPYYDPKTTMLIFDKDPIRNEKISSSIVSGVPCLHHSYVRMSYHQNNKKWLDPLDYMHEIEIPDSSDAKSMRSKSEAQDVVRAISHWYQRLQTYPESDKVFENWRVWMMYAGGRGCPCKSFTRILKAGGAEVLGSGLSWPEIEPHVDELTHILAPKENDALFTSERLAVCLENRIKIAAGDVISKAINDNPPAPGILEATSFLPAYEAARKNKYNLD